MERDLSQAGYVLTRVTVPPQRTQPGRPVRIRIVNGQIGQIEVEARTRPDPTAGPGQAGAAA